MRRTERTPSRTRPCSLRCRVCARRSVNQQTSTYSGIYTWDDTDAMKAYQDGTIFQELQANPHLTDVAVSEFSVLTGPTKVTRGEYKQMPQHDRTNGKPHPANSAGRPRGRCGRPAGGADAAARPGPA